MSNLLSLFQVFRRDRRAVTALEYGLIAAVVVVTGLATFSVIGDDLASKFSTVSNSVADGE